MCDRCRNARYGYHVTERKFLANIKASGLSSPLVRTGSWTALDSGSFARDREASLPKKIESRIRMVVLSVMRAGISKEIIIANPLPRMEEMIDIPVTGSTEDNVYLDKDLTAGIGMYCNELADSIVPSAAPASSSSSKMSTARNAVKSKPRVVSRITPSDAASVAEQLRPDHYLVRLAASYEEWRSVIEEKITGQHVYFFVQNHKSVYEKYSKLGKAGGNVILLRVSLHNLAGHEPDDSEASAIMTGHTVLGRFLEYAEPGDEFMQGLPPEQFPGSNTPLWEAKGQWNPLP